MGNVAFLSSVMFWGLGRNLPSLTAAGRPHLTWAGFSSLENFTPTCTLSDAPVGCMYRLLLRVSAQESMAAGCGFGPRVLHHAGRVSAFSSVAFEILL